MLRYLDHRAGRPLIGPVSRMCSEQRANTWCWAGEPERREAAARPTRCGVDEPDEAFLAANPDLACGWAPASLGYRPWLTDLVTPNAHMAVNERTVGTVLPTETRFRLSESGGLGASIQAGPSVGGGPGM